MKKTAVGLIIPARPSVKRIEGWARIRKAHLQKQPNCQICGTKKRLAVHHIVPIWVRPDLEGLQTNMITLCENPKTLFCHFTFGHLGKWKRWNEDIEADAIAFAEKIKTAEEKATEPNPQ
jgi:hypothetical protein